MSKTVIKIENLSKIYRLGEVGTGTLSHDLNRFVRMNILGQDDPYAKVGHVNDRTQKAEKGELVAALRDINLEVKEGQVLGIIGKNGAGKSTLLKLLSRVTSPTTGSIKVKGRLASLLEVGTGFHPEMTGRENIYMNGTIMGMRKWEIDRKLDEIVEFAGVAKYLDTPTKRYSSGMTVRLGFAIAAHLEPEILVVDEVLAVGDAEFQKKAIGKMQDVSQNQGRTVLFVSHNMGAVSNLCNKGFVLQNGLSAFYGKTDESIDFYLKNQSNHIINEDLHLFPRKDGLGSEVLFTKISLFNSNGTKTKDLMYCEPFTIEVEFKAGINIDNINVGIRFDDQSNNSLVSTLSGEQDIYFKCINNQKLMISYDNLFLIPGQYFLTLSLRKNGIFMDELHQCFSFEVNEMAYKGYKPHSKTWGKVKYYPSWKKI
ncbi:MAG: ABC transporter ATP-binding protein [Carboxylicivirga sp.]|jgi:lipopolysaccharide transport system ATP-binding protein|nr:ABC transporter ATP-binding protein [Carboxylicivirga sp.]